MSYEIKLLTNQAFKYQTLKMTKLQNEEIRWQRPVLKILTDVLDTHPNTKYTTETGCEGDTQASELATGRVIYRRKSR